MSDESKNARRSMFNLEAFGDFGGFPQAILFAVASIALFGGIYVAAS